MPDGILEAFAANGGSENDRRLARLLVDSAPADAANRLGKDGWLELAAKVRQLTANKAAGQHQVSIGPAGKSTLVAILNDDMPFLVDSVMGEIKARDLAVEFVLHPTFRTERDANGQLKAITGPGTRDWRQGQESLIVAVLDELTPAAAESLKSGLDEVLDQVRLAVTDWQAMLARLKLAIEAYRTMPPPGTDADQRETIAFLEWLAQGNFTLLGMRELEVADGNLRNQIARGLGILRNPEVRVLRQSSEQLDMSPEVRGFYFQSTPLIISKANVVSKVHRRAQMDYVGVKSFDTKGAITGELRIAGLFTSGAYTQSVRQIPLLRQKAEQVIAASPYAPDSHNGKAIANILETFPRDELFAIGPSELSEWTTGLLDLELRPRTRLFVRRDAFDRFISALVYLPRERTTTDVSRRIGECLEQAYHGKIISVQPYFPEGPLVRIQFVVALEATEAAEPPADTAKVEADILALTQDWQDRFVREVKSRFAAAVAMPVIGRFSGAFGDGYRETFSPGRALKDIARLDVLSDENPVAIDFYREAGTPATDVRVALYRLDQPIPLSERVPVFENMGFRVIDERSYRLRPMLAGKQRDVRLHDMLLKRASADVDDLVQHDQRLEDCFLAAGRGETEDDPFNGLILAAGFDWRQAMLMRALAAYLRQIRAPFGPRYIAETLLRYTGVTKDLFALFQTRFDPAMIERVAASDVIRARIETGLQATTSIDEDRILRHYQNLIEAMTRTTFFAMPGELVGMKFDCTKIDRLPNPKPFAEIFVYSPRVEGVHMRFSPIARGGLRWSDRAQDFRTEVLGLVKAQQVKNAVIVPAGAKGGFLPKRLPRDGTREEIQAEGTAAYDIFIGTLLDLTDNFIGDKLVPPANVVRHDADDPYLVVAADKGTATFSDRANALSEKHNFWLGDAFASGGSAGYDHKKMAITARGGWESVSRHFREMDMDIETTAFRVIGVGDMSGDVFGNAMLLSPETRLVAAFDHRDIFIDPDPHPIRTLAERHRLFGMARSSWKDFAAALISPGGGIFSRTLKSIPLSPEIQKLIGSTATALAPNDLIHALLAAPCDLLWFGGIGTYVRANFETDEMAGDRANDAVRITAGELQAKVIGEGANLALTQGARIEFAIKGGRLNTDFIDNSAGVNSSDLEVNIKIALRPVVSSGKLTLTERNTLLASMTDEVAAAVLRNNYLQGLALSIAGGRGNDDMASEAALIRELERRANLDRKLEGLPTDAELARRALTRPERAVLLSYSKIDATHRLLGTNVLDDPALKSFLTSYFPRTLYDRFPKEIESHRLAREIIATALANAMVNRGGAVFESMIERETGATLEQVARAFVTVLGVFDLADLWPRIDQLDNKISGAAQLDLYREVEDFVRVQTGWFAEHADFTGGVGQVVTRYRNGVADYARTLMETLSAKNKARFEAVESRYLAAGVPKPEAVAIASLRPIAEASSVVDAAIRGRYPVAGMAAASFAVAGHFGLDELVEMAAGVRPSDSYDRLAFRRTLAILGAAKLKVASEVHGVGMDAWLAKHQPVADAVKARLAEIAAAGPLTISRLTVAASEFMRLG